MDNPDSVRRVRPPTAIINNTIIAKVKSQKLINLDE
jgi:hypothetical protein